MLSILKKKEKDRYIPVGPMTDEEYDVVAGELVERLYDVIHQNFKRRMPEKRFYETVGLEDNITVSYDFKFVGNDVAQILGRLRRVKK